MRPLPDILDDCATHFGRDVVPTVIKIDVEGFEYNVWKGCRNQIKALDHVTILLEFTPDRYRSIGQDPEAFMNEMLADGFAISGLNHDGSETIISEHNKGEFLDAKADIDLILRK